MPARILPLLRFHLATAVPASLRALVPLAAAVTIGIAMQPNPVAAVGGLVLAVVGPAGSGLAELSAAAVLLVITRTSGDRIGVRADAWIRHLPASRRERRAAAAAACAASALPLVAAIGLGGVGLAASGVEVDPLRVAAVATACLPAGAFGILRRRPAAAAIAAAATWLAIAAGWLGIAVAPAAGAVAAAVGRDASSASRLATLPLPSWTAVTLRAAGPRLVGAVVAGAVPVGLGIAFVAANELPAWMVDRVAVLASLWGVVAAVTTASEAVARRRPPWPWVRSLPWSARRRIVEDAVLLASPALPAVAIAAWWRPSALLAIVLVAPAVVVAGTAALRREPGAAFGPSLDVLLVGGVASCWSAVTPAIVVAGPPAAWAALRWAEAREQRLSGVALDATMAYEAEEASR